MRSCAALFVACAVLCAGDSTPEATPRLLEIGDSFEISIRTNMVPESNLHCHLQSPRGETIQLRPNHDGDQEKYNLRGFNLIKGCIVDVKITDKNDEGVWYLAYSDNGEGGSEESVNIAVDAPETSTTAFTKEPNFKIREIEYVDKKFFNTSLGKHFEVKIRYFDFVPTESCHIKTPEGIEYNLKDLQIEGIEEIVDTNVACGITVNVISENFIGKWLLFSRDTRLGTPIERRFDFTIYVEEIVQTTPKDVIVRQGNDLYLRLEKPTRFYNTCKLVKPCNYSDTSYFIDENHREECGFVITNVRVNDTGRWEIVYGERIIYKAFVQVTVNEPLELEPEEVDLDWTLDSPLDQLVGPQDAIFCRVVDPRARVHSEGFGRCRITLGRVTMEHNGVWTMEVGTPGKVLTEKKEFEVTVKQAAPRARVLTHVEDQEATVVLSCALEGQLSVRSCKFREPSGRVLLAAQGVGEDRYTSHGVGVRLESNANTTQCGLRITNLTAEDMGLWRCAMETTDDEVFFGFLTVTSRSIVVPAGDPVFDTEPKLTAAHSVVAAMEGEAVTMSCAVQTEILYCYFRARNGTIFSVSPGTVSDRVQYVGAGFDAGECGVTFSGLQEQDSGPWSCHVGFEDTKTEQRATFSVNIYRQITVYQGEGLNPGSLVVSARVYDDRQVDYCRFVRIDGLGFDSRNPPAGYTNNLNNPCWISIAEPSMLDHHPWTVAARITGQDVEVYGSSDHTLEMPTPRPDTPIVVVRYSPLTTLWIMVFMVTLAMVTLSINLSNKKNRQWAYSRASALRNSFRRTPPPPMGEKTPQAA